MNRKKNIKNIQAPGGQPFGPSPAAPRTAAGAGLRGTNFISAEDVKDIGGLVSKALEYKANPFRDRTLGLNKRIGLLFLNPSMRTRISTQIAAQNLGMETIVFNIDKEGWALEFEEEAIMSGHTVEHVKDAAPIFGKYFDIVCIRTFPSLQNKKDDYSELYIKQFIKYAGIPVVSLESATLHPLQSLTDILTITEHFPASPSNRNSRLQGRNPAPGTGRRPKIVLTWAPHVKSLPQCVANSFSQWVNAWGAADFVITHPEDYELDPLFTRGARIILDQDEALKEADFVYVKNWSTYEDYGKMYCNDPGWMLTIEKLKRTNNAKIMHCLPVRRNVELSDEVLDSANSIVTQQASNRVWAAQAVLASILSSIPPLTPGDRPHYS
jgi:N-succinyl-L-ornithine transcarbamylase